MHGRLTIAALATLGTLAFAAPATAQQPIAIATSKSGSLYNSTAAAIGKVLGEKAGLKITIQAFGGSSQYLPVINAGELPFGIANVFETNLAVQGKEYFKGRPTKDVRAVTILYPLRLAIFVRKDSDIKSIADLKGKRGPVGFTSQKILVPVLRANLATGGVSLDDIKGVSVASIAGNANAFKEGRIDFFVSAVGSGRVREVDAAVGGLRLLPVSNTPEALAAARKIVPVAYFLKVKPGRARTGVLEEGYVMAYGANLFASTKTPDDIVYKMVKGLHDNGKDLGKVFGPLRLFRTGAMAQQIPGVEYHSGAIKYYKEIDQWPPAAP